MLRYDIYSQSVENSKTTLWIQEVNRELKYEHRNATQRVNDTKKFYSLSYKYLHVWQIRSIKV